MIQVEGIYKAFGENVVLNDVSFSLRPGEFVGIVGPSGSGKSVLLKIIAGIVAPDGGVVKQITNSSARLRVGFLFQEGALFDSLSVLDNVSFPLLIADRRTKSISRDEAYSRAASVLDDVGLLAAVNKLPGQLSGGMRRRVGIARALVARPEVVLLDDPTGGLDPVAASVIVELIRELHKLYRPTVLLVSHDIRRLIPNVERLLALFGGELVLDAKPQEVLQLGSEAVVRFLKTRYSFDHTQA